MIEMTMTRLNDLYLLGNHRLLCGDCTDVNNVKELVGNDKVAMLLTDPPYRINYAEKNKHLEKYGKNNSKRITNDILNDNLKNYQTFFYDFLVACKEVLDSYNTCYIFMSGQNLHILRSAFELAGFYWSDYLIWLKNNAVMTRKDYNPKHEFILYGWFKRHKFYGGYPNTILEYKKLQKSNLHPTMKPVNLLERLIADGCKEGDVVLDVFSGSGSTLIASHNTNRIGYMMELDTEYCDVIVNRYIDLVGNSDDVYLIRDNKKIKYNDLLI